MTESYNIHRKLFSLLSSFIFCELQKSLSIAVLLEHAIRSLFQKELGLFKM